MSTIIAESHDIILDPPPSKEEWEYAKVRTDPYKRFALWMVNDGLCQTPEDFRLHFAPMVGIDYSELMESLERDGYLNRVGNNYRVASKGLRVLREPNESVNRRTAAASAFVRSGLIVSDPPSETNSTGDITGSRRGDGQTEQEEGVRVYHYAPRNWFAAAVWSVGKRFYTRGMRLATGWQYSVRKR